jgi:CMP-N,N'-diacetyllegionaminic acid synthase|tara:strand:+ start:640 stop:1011 length:372 start_codon:yes stop_codon:yes gene_type:complete
MHKNLIFKKKLCFDIDGVICKTQKYNDYKKSKPIKKNINFINKLYNNGYEIIIFTARYMGRMNNNKVLAEKKISKLTLFQLKKWGVNYHQIFFGKPNFDIIIDDKALFFKQNWIKSLGKELKG